MIGSHRGGDETIEAMFACGHSKARPKSLSTIRDDMFVKGAARRLCDACIKYHEEVREYLLLNAEARSRDIAAATALRGSPKQIEWAGRIRETWLSNTFDSRFKGVRWMRDERSKFEKANIGASPEVVEEAINQVAIACFVGVEKALGEDRSWYWIDDRKEFYHFNTIISKHKTEAIESEIARLTKVAA